MVILGRNTGKRCKYTCCYISCHCGETTNHTYPVWDTNTHTGIHICMFINRSTLSVSLDLPTIYTSTVTKAHCSVSMAFPFLQHCLRAWTTRERSPHFHCKRDKIKNVLQSFYMCFVCVLVWYLSNKTVCLVLYLHRDLYIAAFFLTQKIYRLIKMTDCVI